MDAEQRIAAVRAAMGEVKTKYATLDRSCTSCIYGPIKDATGKCEHFVHWQINHDPVTGSKKLRIPVTTHQARSTDGLCGPEGLLFEPYRGWRRGARWLARMHPQSAAYLLFWVIIGGVLLLGFLLALIISPFTGGRLW